MIKMSNFRRRKIAPVEAPTENPPIRYRRISVLSFFSVKSLFFWIVIFPTIISSIYFLFIASDLYISEAKFIIRQSDSKKNLSGIGAFLESAGITTSREDVYTLKEYIMSRDALHILEKNLFLSKMYSDKIVDFVNRYNLMGGVDSFEKFYEFYKNNIVSVDIDTASSIFTIKVKAYTPKLAHAIASALLFVGEGFVNELNKRAQEDLINFSLQEVDAAETAAKAAELALSDYRSRQMLFDPAQQSTIQLKHIAKLQSDLVEVRGQIAQLRTFTKGTPYIKSLEKRRNELQKEINSAMSTITGGSNSMVQKISEYERLTIDRDFLEKRLVVALSSLAQARSEAQRQRLYLATISKPNMPDSTRYPERGFDIVVTLFIGLLVYGCLYILIIGAKEHQL